MATLLHLDSSLLPDGISVSRDVADRFRKEWETQLPASRVIYRDLSAAPLPHAEFAGVSAAFTAPEDRTPEQAAAFALREALATELEEADAVLIAAPMYNYTISSTLKAWLDHVIIKDRTFGSSQSAKGTPTIVVASRGGSFAPGTPREGWDFVQSYLEKVLGELLGLDVEFIVPELTYAFTDPSLAHLADKAEASRIRAYDEATAKARDLASRFSW
jgi:FMN-dependent NADH-azoreductase